MSADVLVLGSGPAALAIASELGQRGLVVHGLSALDPESPWPNTYGIWGHEVDQLGLQGLLAHRWSQSISYFLGANHAEQAPLVPLVHGLDQMLHPLLHLNGCRHRCW